MSQHYLIMYRPPRNGFAENATPEESAEVMKHFEYLKALNVKKTVLIAGRVNDARFGIALLETETEQEAQQIMNDDPAVIAKVFTAELLPFSLALR
ncbi:MAG: hypothetical protein IIA17_10240 [candidate division Zixibacteria bacterium]|nr:hypothetical protein [candidate division Zixibacteria bacterium]